MLRLNPPADGRIPPQTHTGPFPASFYSSLPTLGKESGQAQYYITSVKGFSSGAYYAILNSSLQLIGQAHSSKKASAIEEAEEMAKDGRVLEKVRWKFEDRSGSIDSMKKVNLMKKPKEATGAVPLLTHALAVEEKEKARLAWLEWYSEDKKMLVLRPSFLPKL